MPIAAPLLMSTFEWTFYQLAYGHPIISIVLCVWILRHVLRWLFGINKIRRAQGKYTELLEQHNDLLQKQTEMLEQHRSVLGKLKEKYL